MQRFILSNINIFSSIVFHLGIMFALLFFGKLQHKNQEIYKINISLGSISETILKKNDLIDNKSQPNQEKKDNKITHKTESTIEKKVNKKKSLNIIRKNEINKKKEPIKKEKVDTKKASQEKVVNEFKKNKITNEKNKSYNLPLTKLPKIKKQSHQTDKSFLSSSEEQLFLKYKENLKFLIQKKAAKNYPRVSKRKNEEGNVELIFLIDKQGNIKNIKVGKKTNAPERLIKSSIKTLELISPYKKNKILEKKNTFTIIIVYKLN